MAKADVHLWKREPHSYAQFCGTDQVLRSSVPDDGTDYFMEVTCERCIARMQREWHLAPVQPGVPPLVALRLFTRFGRAWPHDIAKQDVRRRHRERTRI